MKIRPGAALKRLYGAAPGAPSLGRGSVTSPYDAMPALTEHIGGADRREDLARVLQVAEEVLERGTNESVDLVATGLIENLQLLASFPDTALAAGDVASLLGPRGTKVWAELDEKWHAVWRSGTVHEGLDLYDYGRISDADLKRIVRSSFRVMPDGRLVGLPQVLAYETRQTVD